MRPDPTEQLHGIRRVLAETVAPLVHDPYVADVLAGLLASLDMLADGWAQVPAFLRWDSEATRAVLRGAGYEVPPGPDDPLDLAAWQAHHREVRHRLEAAVPTLVDDDLATTAMIQLFRDRADRFPFVTRRQGGPPAHAPR
jgi:hypothetical protein